MKSLRPWVYLLGAASSSLLNATEAGLEVYRQGDYMQAAKMLSSLPNKDAASNYYLGLMYLYGYGQLKNDDMALKYFIQAADKNYLPAQKLLAHYYLIHANNPEQALSWFKKAAALNDVSAQMYVASAYLFGYGVKSNEDIARRYYIDAAKNGNAIAQYTLADNFINSRQSPNKKIGLIWLKKSADSGNLSAMTLLANLHATGNLVPKDTVIARQLLETAAKGNYYPAMVSLGELAWKNNNDAVAAKEWLARAADAGNPQGQRALADLLLDPKSPLVNTGSGYLWMLKAAQNGDKDAQLGMAKIYRDGIGKPINKDLAAEWTVLAGKNETAKSRVPAKIAAALWLSNGKSKSFAEGKYKLGGIYTSWSNAAALKENHYNQAPQMLQLSRQKLYKPQFVMANPIDISISDYFDILAPMLGNNTPKDWRFPRYDFDPQIEAVLHDGFRVMRQDPNALLVERGTPYRIEDLSKKPWDYFDEKARNWEYKANLQMALDVLYNQAILGESSAQFELGQLYQYGIGIAKNIPQAISYFELAAQQHDIRAEYNLGLIYLEGQTTPVDYKKGMEWMNDAAFKGNAYAQYVLANIYENGLKTPEGTEIVAPDHDQSVAMYYLSSSNHYGDAEYRLADYLVKDKNTGLSGIAKQEREKLIKRLYQGAVKEGNADAVLPLAFYNAMDPDPEKQKQAFLTAQREAGQGSKEAALLLGMMLERGIATPENKTNALYWYSQAGMDNPVSAFILGTYYAQGNGLSKDLEKGMGLLQQSADAGFSYANLNLGILKHEKGEAFKAELDKARVSGNSKAGLLLADTYLLNADDAAEVRSAAEIYRYFADKGNRDAQMKLGFYYDRGLDGTPNPLLAARWYTLAAEQGLPLAQYLLGELYQLGRLGQEPDYALAKKWYQAASTGFPEALTALSFVFDTVDNDYASARNFASLSANKAEPIGQYNLGLIYEYGKGIPEDAQKAFEYYQQAANAGYAPAMTQLAGLYLKGSMGSSSPDKALEWYKKAAELGDVQALYQMGVFAEKGLVSKVDYKEALEYYQKADEAGNELASMAMASMHAQGLGTPKDYAKAEGIYKKLVDNHNAFAAYQLGRLYLNGQLGETKTQEGMLLLQQARDNGNNQAAHLLQELQLQKERSQSRIVPMAEKSVSMKKPSGMVVKK